MAILRARERIKQEATWLGIAFSLWTLTRDLRNLTRLQETVLEVPDGVITEDQLKEYARHTGELLLAINGLIDTAKRRRLTNRSLTAGPLRTIGHLREEIAEHLDVIQISLDKDVEESIRQGRQDFSEGRGVPLDSLLQ